MHLDLETYSNLDDLRGFLGRSGRGGLGAVAGAALLAHRTGAATVRLPAVGNAVRAQTAPQRIYSVASQYGDEMVSPDSALRHAEELQDLSAGAAGPVPAGRNEGRLAPVTRAIRGSFGGSFGGCKRGPTAK